MRPPWINLKHCAGMVLTEHLTSEPLVDREMTEHENV